MLPSVTFAQASTLGGARRFAVSFLLPIPALLYISQFGEAGFADNVAAMMREGGVHFAQALGASGPGALFVAALMGTFVIPMLGFALAWSAGRMGTSQVMLVWFAQTLINVCQYLSGAAPAPASAAYSHALRLPGLEALGLTGVSMGVGAGFFLLGGALFVIALVLPVRYATGRTPAAPAPRKTYPKPVW